MRWEEFLQGLAVLDLDGETLAFVILGAAAIWRSPAIIRAVGEVAKQHREVSHRHSRALNERDKALKERQKALARSANKEAAPSRRRRAP